MCRSRAVLGELPFTTQQRNYGKRGKPRSTSCPHPTPHLKSWKEGTDPALPPRTKPWGPD